MSFAMDGYLYRVNVNTGVSLTNLLYEISLESGIIVKGKGTTQGSLVKKGLGSSEALLLCCSDDDYLDDIRILGGL